MPPKSNAPRRLTTRPIMQRLKPSLQRVKGDTRRGVLLYDCHSIRSQIPFLFEGAAAGDFNIGTNQWHRPATRVIEARGAGICQARNRLFDCVLNGRFKGGWTTRHYGRPARGAARHPDGTGAVHAYLAIRGPALDL
jgi:N-formylglutamate deformylase